MLLELTRTLRTRDAHRLRIVMKNNPHSPQPTSLIKVWGGVCCSARHVVVGRGVSGAVGRGVRRRGRGGRVAGGAAAARAAAGPPRPARRVRRDPRPPAHRHLPPCQVSTRYFMQCFAATISHFG